MSTRQPHFELVRSRHGWRARFIAANGRVIFWTETYSRRIDAARAIALMDTAAAADAAQPERIRERDVR